MTHDYRFSIIHCDLFNEPPFIRSDPEHGHAEDVRLRDGTLIKVFPQKKRMSKYRQKCALDFCDIQFEPEMTIIIGAMLPDDSGQLRLNDQDKHFYVCFDHAN